MLATEKIDLTEEFSTTKRNLLWLSSISSIFALAIWFADKPFPLPGTQIFLPNYAMSMAFILSISYNLLIFRAEFRAISLYNSSFMKDHDEGYRQRFDQILATLTARAEGINNRVYSGAPHDLDARADAIKDYFEPLIEANTRLINPFFVLNDEQSQAAGFPDLSHLIAHVTEIGGLIGNIQHNVRQHLEQFVWELRNIHSEREWSKEDLAEISKILGDTATKFDEASKSIDGTTWREFKLYRFHCVWLFAVLAMLAPIAASSIKLYEPSAQSTSDSAPSDDDQKNGPRSGGERGPG